MEHSSTFNLWIAEAKVSRRVALTRSMPLYLPTFMTMHQTLRTWTTGSDAHRSVSSDFASSAATRRQSNTYEVQPWCNIGISCFTFVVFVKSSRWPGI
ncbi:hypothetical protein M404DRAFT_538528 [Pisolithus tinctorius Marx 270]|uniref:Uncharacterized protein n=1 Tax=Pisolithus tinctorius Marx 270 TaxID=870435 RepID=A0A0C3K570_PISTI|nr:hypothetical protein M404DRAFT_538528 [Pisolithus tinctorius Marx 270]